jgi:hypothetical protein
VGHVHFQCHRCGVSFCDGCDAPGEHAADVAGVAGVPPRPSCPDCGVTRNCHIRCTCPCHG